MRYFFINYHISYLSRSAWDTWIIVSTWFVREESSKAKAPAAPKPAADTAANWAAFGSDTSAPAASSGGDNWASVFDSQPTTTTAGDAWSAAFSSQTTATTTTTASSGTATSYLGNSSFCYINWPRLLWLLIGKETVNYSVHGGKFSCICLKFSFFAIFFSFQVFQNFQLAPMSVWLLIKFFIVVYCVIWI